MTNQPSKISDWEKELKEKSELWHYRFRSNSYWERTMNEIETFIENQRTEVLEEVANNIQEIIEKSKATFFVNKDSKDITIPTDEALYELKAEISDNIGMYFYEKLNQLKNKEKYE
ncbi:MAG: hypothetical protein AABY22_31210 [Nanoarchaeota archaeon]